MTTPSLPHAARTPGAPAFRAGAPVAPVLSPHERAGAETRGPAGPGAYPPTTTAALASRTRETLHGAHQALQDAREKVARAILYGARLEDRLQAQDANPGLLRTALVRQETWAASELRGLKDLVTRLVAVQRHARDFRELIDGEGGPVRPSEGR